MTTRFHVSGMVHVNINVSDFDRSRIFYEALGFKLVWRVPPTNSVEVAAAVGMPPYRVKGGLMALEGAAHPVVIDLLEWETPRETVPPYPHLYHYGLARLALSTTDMDADLATLAEMGVELVGWFHVIKVTILYPAAPGRLFDHDYYETVHVPMAIEILGEALQSVTVERGISPGPPWPPATYSTICSFVVTSREAYERALFPNAGRLQADVANFSDVAAVIQFSEISLRR
jgi:uncharacterized protein (TIGR02118 family)